MGINNIHRGSDSLATLQSTPDIDIPIHHHAYLALALINSHHDSSHIAFPSDRHYSNLYTRFCFGLPDNIHLPCSSSLATYSILLPVALHTASSELSFYFLLVVIPPSVTPSSLSPSYYEPTRLRHHLQALSIDSLVYTPLNDIISSVPSNCTCLSSPVTFGIVPSIPSCLFLLVHIQTLMFP